ncbi:hypothetical protein GCM10009609_65640 [Pseudonocardia aurantiaca]|uniref:ThuA domain-containing protein n=1 Tax=Pseudonocardia aurantiaca TaxID=75290 RepID=A0ABW4FSY2_9PSEU
MTPHVPTAPTALILAGHGRYADPWHDTAAIALCLARAVERAGLRAEVRGTSPHALEEVAPDVALLIVTAGRGRRDPDVDGDDADWAPFHERLTALIAAGTPVLALHQAANTFADNPEWATLLGGRWVPGTSMHPPIGPAVFDIADRDHPVTGGLTRIEVFDERYCHLALAPGSRVLPTARHDGVDHPVAWVAAGPQRVIYDGTGHDVRAYASPDRDLLLQRELRWLTSGGGEATSLSRPAT